MIGLTPLTLLTRYCVAVGCRGLRRYASYMIQDIYLQSSCFLGMKVTGSRRSQLLSRCSFTCSCAQLQEMDRAHSIGVIASSPHGHARQPHTIPWCVRCNRALHVTARYMMHPTLVATSDAARIRATMHRITKSGMLHKKREGMSTSHLVPNAEAGPSLATASSSFPISRHRQRR